MSEFSRTLSAADTLAHVCAEVGGMFDVCGTRDVESLVALFQRGKDRLLAAAKEYWDARNLQGENSAESSGNVSGEFDLTKKTEDGCSRPDNQIFYSNKPQDVTGLDPNDLVVVVDVNPYSRDRLMICKVSRLKEVFEYDKKWNEAKKDGIEPPPGAPLLDKNDCRLLVSANPREITCDGEGGISTSLPEGFSLDNTALFCKRANELRRKLEK